MPCDWQKSRNFAAACGASSTVEVFQTQSPRTGELAANAGRVKKRNASGREGNRRIRFVMGLRPVILQNVGRTLLSVAFDLGCDFVSAPREPRLRRAKSKAESKATDKSVRPT